jgi:hypothetical protein
VIAFIDDGSWRENCTSPRTRHCFSRVLAFELDTDDWAAALRWTARAVARDMSCGVALVWRCALAPRSVSLGAPQAACLSLL